MGRFDYFVGELRCPACGVVSQADSSTNMQTKIALTSQGDELGVGNTVVADWNDIPSAGYLPVQLPFERDTFVLLDTWACCACDKPFNWARVVIVRSVIREVSAVVLTLEAIYSANYISEDCFYLFSEPGDDFASLNIDSLRSFLRSQKWIGRPLFARSEMTSRYSP